MRISFYDLFSFSQYTKLLMGKMPTLLTSDIIVSQIMGEKISLGLIVTLKTVIGMVKKLWINCVIQVVKMTEFFNKVISSLPNKLMINNKTNT